MSAEICVCQACGNIYLVTETRFYCPVCSGNPIALEGLTGEAEPAEEEMPEEAAPVESTPPQGEQPALEEPPPEKPKRRRRKK